MKRLTVECQRLGIVFPLVAPEVRREYGFSLAGAGLLSTVFTLGMAVAGLPAGYLLARYGQDSKSGASLAPAQSLHEEKKVSGMLCRKRANLA